jgi:lipopolysaccharide export system ATP-binding protein
MVDILEVDSVLKSFNDKQVLTDIYVKCSTGDIIGLLGRNSIGKTTLMKIIFGILKAENKFIRINQQIHEKPYLKNCLIQYLPQNGFLPANLKVKEIVELYFKGDEIENILNDELLKNVITTKISNLSSGEGRYLEIKLLLLSKSKFVLLDEPFNGIAPILIDSIKALIIQQSKNKGIILTDHDYHNVFDVATKYFVMFDGGLKVINNKSDLITWGYLPEQKN